MFLDRLTKEVPSVLTPDLKAKFAAANQVAESDFKMRSIEREYEKRKETKELEGWRKPSVKSIKPIVPHAEMHKKTYFNAIEKLLTNPSKAPRNQNEIDPTTWGPGMIFENSIKHPPARCDRQADNENEWYDNYIEPHNLEVRKSPKYNKFVSGSGLSMKTNPEAIL